MLDAIQPSLNDVASLLKLPKILVNPMRWRPRLSKQNPQWLEFASAVEANGEVLEAINVRFQWRPQIGVQLEKFNVAIFMESCRVYAIDIDPSGRHKNKLGWAPGRDYESKIISGIHEHLWTEYGYGYAKPLVEQTGWTPERLWVYFCNHIALSYDVFVAPDARGKIGQQSLL